MRPRAAFLFLFATSVSSAQTPYPGITSVFPVAVSRGKQSEVRIAANYPLEESHRVLVSGTGVSAKVLPRNSKDGKNTARIQVEVAPDALPGPREIRLATKKAITTMGLLFVTPIACVRENPQNNTREKAQAIELPSVVCGRIEKNVEEDWFQFSGKANERVTFTVVGSRMHGVIHKVGRFVTQFDPMLKIIDSDGRELASNDDFLFADSVLSAVLPKDGTYYLCLREATYKGHEMFTYALSCRKGAQPTHTFPLAVAPGSSSKVRLLGEGFDANENGELLAPKTEGFQYLAAKFNGSELQPTLVYLSSMRSILADRLASTPNAVAPAKQKVELPVGIDGILESGGVAPSFVFDVKKDQWYRMEMFARRLYSPVDGEFKLTDEKGRELARNDDYRSPAGRLSKDPRILWKAPRDMTVELSVRDMMGKSSEQSAYRIELEPAAADVELSCDPQLAMIGPGSRSVIYVRAQRLFGMNQPVKLFIEGLSKGVTAVAGTIPENQQDGCIVLEAAADAKLDASNVRIGGRFDRTNAGKTETVTRFATPLAEIYQAQRLPVETVAIAVTEPSDIKVEAARKRVELKPGESVTIPVEVIRNEKYKTGPVTLWADWRFGGRVFGNSLPPGVTLDQEKSSTNLTGNSTKGSITLTAANNARPTKEPVLTVVLAQVSIEFSVSVVYCSAPIEVVVLPGRAQED